MVSHPTASIRQEFKTLPTRPILELTRLPWGPNRKLSMIWKGKKRHKPSNLTDLASGGPGFGFPPGNLAKPGGEITPEIEILHTDQVGLLEAKKALPQVHGNESGSENSIFRDIGSCC